MTILFYLFLVLFLVVCAVLALVVLVQEAKSLGLGASFGGDAGDSLFGTSTADVLKRFTVYMAGAFLVGCFILSFWGIALSRPVSEQSLAPLQQEALEP